MKLRHTHPRVKKQRAAAATLAAAVATASITAASTQESVDLQQHFEPAHQQQHGDGSSSSGVSAAGASVAEAAAAAGAAAAAAVNQGVGIQIVHVVPWQPDDAGSDGSNSSTNSPAAGAANGGLLLEMDRVSINTPDGGLALVQDLDLKVHAGTRTAVVHAPCCGAACCKPSCLVVLFVWCRLHLAHSYTLPIGACPPVLRDSILMQRYHSCGMQPAACKLSVPNHGCCGSCLWIVFSANTHSVEISPSWCACRQVRFCVS